MSCTFPLDGATPPRPRLYGAGSQVIWRSAGNQSHFSTPSDLFTGEYTISPPRRQALLSRGRARQRLVESLFRHYHEKERFAYGPDDERGKEVWRLEIETKEAFPAAVSLETIVVAEDFQMDEGRRIYLLFSRTWGGGDLEDNGIGVCCINEESREIGCKEIAF